MALRDRIEKAQHERHERDGVLVESCRFCPKDTRPVWLKGLAPKDMTGTMKGGQG